MGNPKFKTERAKILGEVSVALFEMRDALMELSLTLRDWQFETDQEKRKTAEATVHHLLQQIAAAQRPAV